MAQSAHIPQAYSFPNQAPASTVESASKPALALIAIRASMLPIRFLTFKVLAQTSPIPRGAIDETHPSIQLRHTVGQVFNGLEGLLTFCALIAFFVWFARAYGFIRNTRGGTRYSTGLAIGGWFIPFANLIMPYLAVRDAQKRSGAASLGPIVALWWVSWLGMTFLNVLDSMMETIYRTQQDLLLKIGTDTLNAINDATYWGGIGFELVTFGSFFLIVRGVTAALVPKS